ncbi:MAG TPA: hypothetical protein VEB40_06035 [Flavipsychrobacter sp.]|nr:hypothetical protein [Flavipsychrobacter sp.]
MKKLNLPKAKPALLAAAIAIFSFITVVYTSCTPDKCKDVVCQNGGTCGEGNCTCPTGFSGTLCATNDATKFLGTWTGSTNCGSGTQLIITQGTGATILISSNAGTGSCFKTFNMVGTVNGNTATFNQTELDNCANSYTMAGTATITGNSITFSMNFSGAITASCTFAGTK